MKAILVIDVPVLDDSRHLCDECLIWNREKCRCEYDKNANTKGCPLKPIPSKRETRVYWKSVGLGNIPTHDISDYDKGWNDCVDTIEEYANEFSDSN